MFYRFFAASIVFTLVSTLSFQQVFAINSDLCSVKIISEGSLSSNAAGHVKRLSSFSADGGNSSELEVNCSVPAKLVINVVQIEGDSLDPAVLKAIATNQSTGISTKSGDGALDMSQGTNRVLIDLIVDKGNPLHAGKYKFNVTLNFS